MSMHPESLYALGRQRQAELIREAELDRLARAVRPRKPGLLSFRRYPGVVIFARRTWDTVTGLFAGAGRAAAGTPGGEQRRSTTAVAAAAVGGSLTGSSPAGSR